MVRFKAAGLALINKTITAHSLAVNIGWIGLHRAPFPAVSLSLEMATIITQAGDAACEFLA
jgi:hypothetical protein